MTRRAGDTDQEVVLRGRLQPEDGDAGDLGEDGPRGVALVPLQVVLHLKQLGGRGGIPLQQDLAGLGTHQTQVPHLDVHCNTQGV